MKYYGVTIWKVQDLLEHAFTCTTHIGDTWVPKRPIGYISLWWRIKAAWLVFTCKADAVVWKDQ